MSHGPWRSKAEFSLPLRSFWYLLLDVQGSKWPEATACWNLVKSAHIKNRKFSDWPCGSVCMVHIGLKILQSNRLYMRIKKMYTCWGRTRYGDELARFEGFVFFFFFSKSRLSCVFFPLSSQRAAYAFKHSSIVSASAYRKEMDAFTGLLLSLWQKARLRTSAWTSVNQWPSFRITIVLVRWRYPWSRPLSISRWEALLCTSKCLRAHNKCEKTT